MASGLFRGSALNSAQSPQCILLPKLHIAERHLKYKEEKAAHFKYTAMKDCLRVHWWGIDEHQRMGSHCFLHILSHSI